MPMLSAASHHFHLPAMAFRTTSCIFMARSNSAAGDCSWIASTSSGVSQPPLDRTIQLLIDADKSHAADSSPAAAGALGMAVANTPGAELITISLGPGPALPAGLISHHDGTRLRDQLRGVAEPLKAAMSWSREVSPRERDGMNSSSSGGPSPEGQIAPDLSAAGTDVCTGNSGGGFSPTSGTSLSAPLAAGPAALLLAARPGLPFEHYRSLLINTARPLQDEKSGTPLPLNRQGSGSLQLEGAVRSLVTAYPATASFGGVRGGVGSSRSVALFNLSPEPVACSIVVEPARGVAVTASPESVAMDGGGTAGLPLRMSAGTPEPGPHGGYVRLDCGEQHPPFRIPYWLGVTTGRPSGMKRTALNSTGKAGRALWQAARYRIWDEAGRPIDNHPPVATVEQGSGEAVDVWKSALLWPGNTRFMSARDWAATCSGSASAT